MFELSKRVAAAHHAHGGHCAHGDRAQALVERARRSARAQRRALFLAPRARSVWPASAGMTKPSEWLPWPDVARHRGLLHLSCDLGARYRRLWRPGVVLVPDTSSELFASNFAARVPNGHVSGGARENSAAQGRRRAYLAGLRRDPQKRVRDPQRCAAANLWKEEGLRNPAVGALALRHMMRRALWPLLEECASQQTTF